LEEFNASTGGTMFAIEPQDRAVASGADHRETRDTMWSRPAGLCSFFRRDGVSSRRLEPLQADQTRHIMLGTDIGQQFSIPEILNRPRPAPVSRCLSRDTDGLAGLFNQRRRVA